MYRRCEELMIFILLIVRRMVGNRAHSSPFELVVFIFLKICHRRYYLTLIEVIITYS